MKWWLILQSAGLKSLGIALVCASNWDLLGWAIFLTGGLCVAAQHFLPRSQGLCDVVTAFQADGAQVWLTIDDGPHPEDTPRILDLLDAAEARATFFMIGQRAAQYPDLVQAVLARGHTVGTHTHTHPLRDFWLAGRARVARELDDSLGALQAAGAEVRLYRSPAGIRNVFLRRCLKARSLRCVAWGIRSGDGIGGATKAIVARVLDQVRPGSIILMHEGETVAPQVRVQALAEVLQGLGQRGYRCVLPADAKLLP